MHTVNLLPAATRADFKRSGAVRRWVWINCLAGAFSAICVVYGQGYAIGLKRHRSETAGSTTAIVDLQAEHRRLRTNLMAIRTYEEKSQSLRTVHSPLSLLEQLKRIDEQLDGRLTVKSLDYKFDAKAASKPTEKETEGQLKMNVVVRGMANAVAIIRLLRDSGYYKDVMLTSALEKVHSASDDLVFSVLCKF